MASDAQVKPPPLDRAEFMIDPHISFEDEFLGHLWSALGAQHLLLMFDEVIRLQEQVQAGILSRDIFEYMRYLMQHHEQLNFLFSLGSGLEEMQQDYAFLFNIALYKKISFLDSNAASALITQPVKDCYHFEQAAVEQILRFTSCHPYYIQLMCHCLFARWQQKRISPITSQDVNDVLDESVERGLAVLKHVWEESTAGEKVIMVAIAEIADKSNRLIDSSMVHRTWENYGVTLPADEIAKATRNLVAREVIGGQGKYAFTVDLQRLWVQKYKRLEWVKEEIADTVRGWAPNVTMRKLSSRWERWRIPLQILAIALILLVFLKQLIPTTTTSVPTVLGTPPVVGQATTTSREALQIYTSVLKREPDFVSLRSREDSTIWESKSTSSGYCSFANAAYHVYVSATKSSHDLTYCFPNGHTFENFVLQVQMTIVRGNGAGIIFRANTSEAKWYSFAIFLDESYILSVYKDLESFTILQGKTNPTIIPHERNKTNLLTVIAQRHDIYLLVNKQYLWKQTDATYSDGDIGLLVADSQNPTDVAFSNVQLWLI
jgi:hypothetical protein